jgi:hypothetical protein
MTEAPAQLTSAIAALWQGPRLDLGGSPQSPLFRKLVEICIELFPEAAGKIGAPDFQGVSWALVNALRATGGALKVATQTHEADDQVKPDSMDYEAIERRYGPVPYGGSNQVLAERYRLAQANKLLRMLVPVTASPNSA